MAGRDSWFRCSCEVWDELIALYTIVADAPLPRELARMDVRRHAHNPQSERDYAARWGWHRSKVRRLIKAGEWRDPYAKKHSESLPTQTRPTTDPQPTQTRPTPKTKRPANPRQWPNHKRRPSPLYLYLYLCLYLRLTSRRSGRRRSRIRRLIWLWIFGNQDSRKGPGRKRDGAREGRSRRD